MCKSYLSYRSSQHGETAKYNVLLLEVVNSVPKLPPGKLSQAQIGIAGL